MAGLDDGSWREGAVFHDNNNPVAHSIILRLRVWPIRDLADEGVGANASIFVDDGALDDAVGANADVAVAAHSALMIDESSLESPLEDALVEHLSPLLADELRRTTMADNMRLLARPDAASLVTDTIRIILGSSATGTIRLAA